LLGKSASNVRSEESGSACNESSQERFSQLSLKQGLAARGKIEAEETHGSGTPSVAARGFEKSTVISSGQSRADETPQETRQWPRVVSVFVA
jgi:hypothetical protein